MIQNSTNAPPQFTSKYLRLIIFDALIKYSNKRHPLTKTQLYNKIFYPDSIIYKNFSVEDNDQSIERTIERTLKDLNQLEFGIANIKVHHITNSRPAKYYAEPINITNSISKIPDPKTLADIDYAIKNKNLITFKYKSEETIVENSKIGNSKTRKTMTNMFPLTIIPYNDMYYLIAYDDKNKHFRHLVMTNIEKLDIQKYSSNTLPKFDKDEYRLQHPYMIEGPPLEISLIIKPYLKQELFQLFEKTAHFSPSGNKNFSIKVNLKSTLDGIKKWVFSNLGNCYIVSPRSLCEDIKNEVKTTNNYINNLMEEK